MAPTLNELSMTVQDPPRRKGGRKASHWGTYLFLTVMAIIWLVPLGWSIFTALRPFADTNK
jgi:multiple sugar transport system permease protein